MTEEEIRKKAIECAKEIKHNCNNPFMGCEYEEYFRARDFSCLSVNLYEHGFADGVKEERRRIYEEYMKAAKADSEASIHGDMFPKNVARFWQEMKGERHE